MKEMQNANMSFAFFGLEAQDCTLQGLFTYGFREVCLNKQFESWGPEQPGGHLAMGRSWQWFSLSIDISAGLGSQCEVTAPDLCLPTHPFIRLLHLSGVSSTAVTKSTSRAI